MSDSDHIFLPQFSCQPFGDFSSRLLVNGWISKLKTGTPSGARLEAGGYQDLDLALGAGALVADFEFGCGEEPVASTRRLASMLERG